MLHIRKRYRRISGEHTDGVRSTPVFRHAILPGFASLIAFVTLVSMSSCGPAKTGELQIAVASNFADAMTRIADSFAVETGVAVSLSFGSTGKIFAQIRHGAPFDAFFAADIRRPQLLEEEGLAVAGSRFTYARGKLALWSLDNRLVDPDGRVLSDSTIRFLAIANPELAPYGRAAREVLEATGVWTQLSEKIVRGENVSQSFQFVKSGNADLGFVAYSHVVEGGGSIEGSVWLVPDSLYTPIEQQAVLLRESDTARRFVEYVRGNEARDIMRKFGYDTP